MFGDLVDTYKDTQERKKKKRKKKKKKKKEKVLVTEEKKEYDIRNLTGILMRNYYVKGISGSGEHGFPSLL